MPDTKDDGIIHIDDSRVKIICPECHGNGFYREVDDHGSLVIKQCQRCDSEGEL